MFKRNCFALLVVFSASASMAAAQLNIVSQDRAIELQVQVSTPGSNPITNTLTMTAPDNGPFNVDQTVQASGATGSGSAHATQYSTIASNQITISGYTGANASAPYPSPSAGSGSAISRMEVVFDVAETVSYSLTGSLYIQSADAHPYIRLSKAGTTLFWLFPTNNFGETLIQRTGILASGTYTLTFWADGSANVTQFWWFGHSASFDLNFAVELVAVPFCFGDGTGTACPCGNNSAVGSNLGCLNSTGQGGGLRATGVPSLANDSLVLLGTQMTGTSVLYFQGTTRDNGGNGSLFGDGKRCAAGTIVRLGVEANAGGASQYPFGADPSISVRGSVGAAGTRTYQAWYRNVATFCTPSGFNLTNGVAVQWWP